MAVFSVPNASGSVTHISVDSHHPLFIVGRNGAGKSALMHRLRQQSPRNCTYLPGSRTALFDGESLSLTPNARRNLANDLPSWDSSEETRWRNFSGNQRNEKAIHDLTAAENQYIIDCAKAISISSDPLKTAEAVARLQSKQSPLDRVNQFLLQSTIPVQMLIADNELKARSGGNTFSYARMSDGERIALILIAEVTAAEPGMVFLIDEPELHLHRSIVLPLISTLVKSRSDCEFIISTHELDLPISLANSRVCIVRAVSWQSNGEVSEWDLDVIEDATNIPEELVIDILGSRRRVLFTEGSPTSLDMPIYSILLPKASIIPKGSCKEVQQAVMGIRSTAALHHTEAFGLIDSDGMSDELIHDYQAQSIYPLPFYSVEALYYDESVLRAVAERQAATIEADTGKQAALAEKFIADVINEGIVAASKEGTAEHLAGRLAERQVRDAFYAQMPKRKDLVAGGSSTIQLAIQSPFPAELGRFQAMLAAKDIYGILRRYPARHSTVLDAIANALKFLRRSDYEAAAVARIATDHNLRHALLNKLAPLAQIINS